MTKMSKFTMALGLMGAMLVLGFHGDSIAQGSLRIGGSSSNFGTQALRGGFMPDPKQVGNIVSGGSLNVANMNLGSGCTGFATQQPDVIVNYTNPAGFLRFYFQGSGDTALAINAANGRWFCNDDTAGLNPQVDIRNPTAGQYDVWVTSYRAGENIRGTLFITEMNSNSVSP